MKVSRRAQDMPASAIRKLVPYSEAAEAAGVKVYHLNVGAPDIKSPDCAVGALEARCRGMHHLSYTHSAGLKELREAMAEKYYRRIGIRLDPSELLITVGGSEAFSMAMQIAANPGDEIIVFEPYYTNYQTFAFLSDITLKAVRTEIEDGFRIPGPEELEKALSPKTRAILISNPCNPSGKLFTKDEILAIGEFCRIHGLFFICDEVYREFCYTDEPYFSAMDIPGCEDNVILVDSVSKRYNLCGARIGVIASRNKDVMSCALKFAQSRLCPPVLGQYASLGALDTPDSYFACVKEEYIRRRDCAVAALNAMPGVFSPVPYGAFYTVARLPVEDAGEFAKWLLTDFRMDGQTVMITPAAAFYKTPGLGRDQARIAYVLEVPQLKKAMSVLATALETYRG